MKTRGSSVFKNSMMFFGAVFVIASAVVLGQIFLAKHVDACTVANCSRGPNQGYFTGAAVVNMSAPGFVNGPFVSCAANVIEPFGYAGTNPHACDMNTGYHQLRDYNVSSLTLGGFLSIVSGNLNADFNACASQDLDIYSLGLYAGDNDWLVPLWSTCYQNKLKAVHAAFIIESMVTTRNGGDPAFGSTAIGVSRAKGDYAAWANLVTLYASNGWVNFNATLPSICEPVWQGGQYGKDVGYIGNNCGGGPAIIFTDPVTGNSYAIVKDCGNIHGNPMTLNLPPDYVVTNLTTSGTLAIGQTISITNATVKNNGPGSASSPSIARAYVNTSPTKTGATQKGGNQADPALAANGTNPHSWGGVWNITTSGTFYIGVCADDGFQVVESNENNNCTWTGPLVVPPPPPTATLDAYGPGNSHSVEVGDPITVQWTTTNATSCTSGGQWSGTPVTIPNGTSPNRLNDTTTIGVKTYTMTCTGPGGPTSPPTISVTITVAAKPYLRVYGGDVMAGAGFVDSSNNCSATSINANAGIITYNQATGPGYAGAGVQYLAQAQSNIYQFASAALRTSAPLPPAGLSLSNTAGMATWHGGFGTASCAIDYFKKTATLPGVTNLASPTIATGAGLTIPLSQHTIYRYNGNITITGSGIRFANADGSGGGWTCDPSSCNTPSFYLIVNGNIDIDPGVTNLDGVYIAQGGTINTCSPFGVACSNQLVINGAFIANQVKFRRINGTLKAAASDHSKDTNIAEIFNYSPDLWIVNPGLVPGTTPGYDSITGLPPVL